MRVTMPGPTDPIALFQSLFKEAKALIPSNPDAMVLATVDDEGRPSARVVLLKSADERGFVFYTNRNSRKGRELAHNPYVALCLHWNALGRQVRVEGKVQPVTPEEADAYFASRARDSQVGAWASQQSEPLENRQSLEARVGEVSKRYEGQSVPRPPHWSGYRVVPERIEFWHEGQARLHERRLFTRAVHGWVEQLLNP
jgi:pyridoxamine 5'-phosphate oxidase